MNSIYIMLAGLGVLEISGEDAATFLQSQLTSDIRPPGELIPHMSAWCNPQGRIIANFYIATGNDRYYLLLPVELLDGFQKRLNMYILRSRLTITDISGDVCCIGYNNDKDSSDSTDTAGLDIVASLHVPDRTSPRSIRVATRASALPETMTTDDDAWQLQDINAGIPWISARTTEIVIPQELELDKLGGLSLDKGCFPGQEIIARLHYRGRVKQGLYRGELPPGIKPPPAGTKFFPGDVQSSCGTVLNISGEGTGSGLLLATLKHEFADRQDFRLEDSRRLDIRFSPSHP